MAQRPPQNTTELNADDSDREGWGLLTYNPVIYCNLDELKTACTRPSSIAYPRYSVDPVKHSTHLPLLTGKAQVSLP